MGNITRKYTAKAFRAVIEPGKSGKPRVSFTRDPAAIAEASDMLHAIFDAHPTLTRYHINGVAMKLANHLTRAGIQDAASIRHFALHNALLIRSAFAQSPSTALDPCNLAGVLNAHRQFIRQRDAELLRKLPTRTPPRPVLWESDDYRIEEATDPRHLVEDTAQLGHCAGDFYDYIALALKNIPRDSPKALHYLYYWGRIRHGTSRILTLTFRRTPQVTIEYDVKSREVLQMHDKGDITGGEAYFPTLCAALASLSHKLPITRLPDLPQGRALRRNSVLTADGQFEAPTVDNVGHAIYGIVPLRKGDRAFNDRACGNPLIQLELDHLGDDDLAALTRIDGHITTMKPRLDLPNLVYLGGTARFPALDVCDMPALEVVGGSIIATALSRASFPLLHTLGGHFFFDRPKAVCIAALTTVGGSTKRAVALKKQHRS